MATIAQSTPVLELNRYDHHAPGVFAAVLCDAYAEEQTAELLLINGNNLRLWLELFDHIDAAGYDPRRVIVHCDIVCWTLKDTLQTKTCVAGALQLWYEGLGRAKAWGELEVGTTS